MADFSHIQAVQTVVGEVFILIIIVQNILRDKTFITEHFKKGTYHRLDKASRCSNSEWLAARNFWQSLAQVRLFYWSPFFVTCQSTHFLFVFVFNHLPNCALIFFNHLPKYALLFVFVDNHLPKSAFFMVLVSFSPAQVCVFILVFVFSFAHVRTFYLPLLFIHPPKYAVFICLLQFVIHLPKYLLPHLTFNAEYDNRHGRGREHGGLGRWLLQTGQSVFDVDMEQER